MYLAPIKKKRLEEKYSIYVDTYWYDIKLESFIFYIHNYEVLHKSGESRFDVTTYPVNNLTIKKHREWTSIFNIIDRGRLKLISPAEAFSILL